MFWIIRLFFRFLLGIWRFFWRLVWTVVILLLIAFGVVWYLSGDFHSAVNQVEKMSKIGQDGNAGSLVSDRQSPTCRR